jgi:Holliday junction resolvase RusA-like endonuclease
MIHIAMQGLPPSLNELYIKTRGGKRALSEGGRKYKAETTALLAQKFQAEMRQLTPNTPFLVLARFYFENVENLGWGKGTCSRYKRIDVTNRIKVLEDCLKDAGGVDDSQNLTMILDKREGRPERVDLWIWNLETETSPFCEPLERVAYL